jgi:hypothetical protein
MSLNPSNLVWPLLGAAVGTAALSVFLIAIFRYDLKGLSTAQRISASGASALVIFTADLVANGLARPPSSLPADPVQVGLVVERVVIPAPTRARAEGKPAVLQSAAPVGIFIAEAAGATSPETAPQPAGSPPGSRPVGTGQLAADDEVHYRDYRGDHVVRLGDAKIVRKGALYFLNLGTIAGLPNEVKISDNDQAKARKWLGE